MSYALQLLRLLTPFSKSLLNASALILGIVNGLFLLKFYLRDRPKLKVRPIHPDIYQWWFRMPDDQNNGEKTRRYGFLAYVDVLNTGLRKTELDSWWICFRTVGQGKHRLDPINMPEPKTVIGELVKYYPVLGQKGINCDGNTLTEPGCSINGMVFFEYECYGGGSWDPIIDNSKISATFAAKGVLGQTCRCIIEFSEKNLDEVKALVPGIHLTSKENKVTAQVTKRSANY
jgi:hypothetical protein